MFFMTKPVAQHIAKFRGVHIDYQLDRKDRYEDNVYQFKINEIRNIVIKHFSNKLV